MLKISPALLSTALIMGEMGQVQASGVAFGDPNFDEAEFEGNFVGIKDDDEPNPADDISTA